MTGSGASDPIPAARRRGPSNGMPQLPLQQAHSRDGQLSGKSDTWYSTRKALCSPHEFYRQYSEAGSGPRSSNDKSSQNRQEYPQVSSTEEHIPSLNASGTPYTASYNSYAFSASASQYTPTAAPNSQLASVPATPSLSATPSVSQDTPHATGSASLMQPSPHGPPPHPNSHSSLGAVSGHPSPGHHSPFEANSPVTAAQAWQIAQRNHRSPLRHASPPPASLHVDDSPRPSTTYPNLDNPADCAALSTLDSYTCLPLPPAGQNPSGSSPIPLFQGSPYLSHALSQSPSSGPLSASGGGRYAMPAPQARPRLTAARHRVTPAGSAVPVATGPHAVAEAAPHAGSVAPGAPRAPHNPMPQQPYASPNSAQAPEGKWPSAATTPESGLNDRNTVSSVSFMHLATAGHSTHDSPREAAPAQAGGGRVGRTSSPANVLPMLRRSVDASNRRRSRHRMTPAHGRVPDRPLSANGPRTTVAAPPVLGHLHGHGPAAQRGPGRRSRSSDSTASPQQGAAHVTAGAVSDDTSVTDHVAPEVSGATVHGEAASSPNEAVSSLSGPENSLMMLHSVESGGGAAATAAAAAAAASGRGEEELYTAPPPRHESAPPASGGAYGSTHGEPGSSSAVSRASARRTFHINHTVADGTPLTSLQPPLHLQPPSSASGISPRPRSVGPAPGGHPKDLLTLPRLRDAAGGMPPRAGGGPDSARDAGSDLGATDSITDERRYYGYGGRYRLRDVNERAAAASPSVSPVATTASRYGVSRDARATANAATASLTRTRTRRSGSGSGSTRRTPRQLGPGPPESGQSHDGHAQSALMRLEAPSSAGADSARVPVGRQRSGSNLYSSAYPKTGASSGGIQACTMDALAAGSASTAHAYRNVPRPESQSSITPGRTTPHYASAYSTGYPPISRRTPRARTGAYGPSSMSSVHSYTSARSSRVPGLDTMDSLVGAGADSVAAALAADTYVPQARDRARRNAAPRPRRTVFAPQARQGAFTSLPALPMGALALRPQSGDGRGDHGGINLDSLLATNNSADGGLLGFLDRAESARIPEPPLPFRETISDNNGEHRNPKLSGSELYSTLLGSLRESLTRGQHQVSVVNGVPLSSASVAGGNGGGGSLAATSSIAMPSSVSGPVEPSASAPVAAAPAAAKRGASKEPSGRGGLMRRRRRHGPRLNPSALSQLQQSLDQGQHTESSVVPVHLFLPPVKITAKSRRGTLRPPRPTFAAHPSPDYSRQAREKSGSSKTVPNPPASMPQPNAPAPLAAAPGFSHGTQGHSQQGLSQQGLSQQGLSQQGLSQQGLSQVTQATSPGTLEGQASRPLSTPPTFPCGRDSPDTPTNEIGSATERGRLRGTPAGAKLGVHGSPAVSQHDLPSQRGGRSQSLLRQTSHTRSLGKRVPMSSAMSDASTTDTAAAVRAMASAQAVAANAAPVTVLNTTTSRPTSRAWLPCMSAPRTIDEGGSESVHNGGVAIGAASTASRSVHGGNKGSSSSTRDVSSSNNGQMSLFKWGLRMSCL
eukprot:jgi/Ulvmu1/9562/UM053_0051.1